MSIHSIQLYMDHKSEIFALLSQLTSADEIEKCEFESIINGLNDNHNIYVYVKEDKIIGMITLLFEKKLIHKGGSVAHIEDLVVDKEYSGQGIGGKLINYCIDKIKNRDKKLDKCYKIILDCKRELIGFYEKFGFESKSVQMSLYL